MFKNTYWDRETFRRINYPDHRRFARLPSIGIDFFFDRALEWEQEAEYRELVSIAQEDGEYGDYETLLNL